MKRPLLALVAAAMIFGSTSPAGAADPIKIGVNLELSGPASGWGTPQLNSIQLYVDEANAKGGINGRQIQIEVLDNKSDPSQAKLNTTKLIDDGVVAILGAGNTPDSMPMIPLVEAAKVPMIANAAAGAVTSPIAQALSFGAFRPSVRSALSAFFAGTTKIIPTPRLKVRRQSSSGTEPMRRSISKSGGTCQEPVSMDAASPLGSTRGRLSVTPPPVM